MNRLKTYFILIACVLSLLACSDEDDTLYEYEDITPSLITDTGWYIDQEIGGMKEMEFYFDDTISGVFGFRCKTVSDTPYFKSGSAYAYELKDGALYICPPLVEVRMITGTLSYRDGSSFRCCDLEIKENDKTYRAKAYQITQKKE